MTTMLTTEITASGLKLTFPNGHDAGRIVFSVVENNYTFEAPFHLKEDGPARNCLEAAEFDALAWASERMQIAAEQSI